MTKTTKAGRAVPRAKGVATIDRAVAIPAGHVETDYATLASELVGAHESTSAEVTAIRAEADRSIAVANVTLLQRIAQVARRHVGFTGAQWDEYLKEPVNAAFKAAGHAMPGPIAAKVKIAFLAFANGIEPLPEYENNAQQFVNKQARAELKAKGIIDAGETRGRKEGSAAPKGVDERKQAAVRLCQTGKDDKATVARRVELLLACTTPGAWKLTEAKLAEIVKILHA